MTDEPHEPQPFTLRRWSQRKLAAAQAPAKAAEAKAAQTFSPPLPPVAAAPTLTVTADVSGVVEPDGAPAPLPPVESLTFESDYSAFMQPKVDEVTKRAALKKLFSDPSFNVMDGLDIYVGDYTQADPMPAGMLEKLSSVYAMLDPVPLPVEEKDVVGGGDGAADKLAVTASATTEAELLPVASATVLLPSGDATVPATDEAESAPGAHDRAQTKRQ